MTSITSRQRPSLTDWLQTLLLSTPQVASEGRALALSGFDGLASCVLIAGDASPRKYYRVTFTGASGRCNPTFIAVDSPASENNHAFLAVRALLESSGVRVPSLIAAELALGYWLLEDLGDDTLLPLLSEDTVSVWYPKALTTLAALAQIPTAGSDLPSYDGTRLGNELALFSDWFVPQLLGLDLADQLQPIFSALTTLLIESAQAQPQVLVHRDYHSRNLMVLNNHDLAVIDFQDAVIGPITYDPVSLLKDCYLRWPRDRQLSWLLDYQRLLEDGGLVTRLPPETMTRWFDLMGLQRHLKVLGIFSRLAIRDGKPDYLLDLPRVLAYVVEALDLYSECDQAVASFNEFFTEAILPACREAPWFSGEGSL